MSQLAHFNASEERIHSELALVRPLLDRLAEAKTAEWAEAADKMVRKHLTPMRTEIERIRTKLNRDNKASVDGEAERLQAMIEAVEKPLADKIKEIKAAERKAAQEEADRRQKEQEAKDAELDRLRKLEAAVLAGQAVIPETQVIPREATERASPLPINAPPKAAVSVKQKLLEFGLKLRTFCTNHFPLDIVTTDKKAYAAKIGLGNIIKTLTGEAK